MKKIILLATSIVVLCSCNSNAGLQKELNAYKAYYEATENLLDTLEHYYNWVDGHDPYDYYEAVSNLPK